MLVNFPVFSIVAKNVHTMLHGGMGGHSVLNTWKQQVWSIAVMIQVYAWRDVSCYIQTHDLAVQCTLAL